MMKNCRIDAVLNKYLNVALTKTGCSGSQQSLNLTNNLIKKRTQRLEFTSCYVTKQQWVKTNESKEKHESMITWWSWFLGFVTPSFSEQLRLGLQAAKIQRKQTKRKLRIYWKQILEIGCWSFLSENNKIPQEQKR